MSRWRALGPACALGARLPSGGRAPFAGACTSLTVSDDASSVFVGADGGGVWVTTDGGSTWTPIFDDQATLHVSALAWHAGALWVGCSRREGRHAALFRGEPADGTFHFTEVLALGDSGVVHRLVSDGSALWAATSVGLFRDTISVALGDATDVVVAGTSRFAVIGTALIGTALLEFGADGSPTLTNAPPAVSAETSLCANGTTVYLASQTADGLVLKSMTVGTEPTPIDRAVSDGGHRPALLHDGTRLLVGAGHTWTLDGGALRAATVNNPGGELAGGVRALLAAGATIWAATDGGVWLSTDHGASWSPRNLGLAVCAITALAEHPSAPAVLLAGTNFGTLRRVGHPIWWVVDGTLTTAAHVEHQDTTRMFTLTGNELHGSTNAGDSWRIIPHDGITGPLALSVATSGTVYLGADTVHASNDHGDSFTALPSLPAGAGRVTVVAPSRFPGVVWAGTSDGAVVRFAQGDDDTWSLITTVSPGTAPISALSAHPSSPDVVFAAHGATVSRIVRSGAAPLTATTADAPGAITALGLDYRYRVLADLAGISTGLTLYVGGAFGVATLECADDGAFPTPPTAFSVVGDGLPNATVTAISINSPARLIRVGTDGRGVWERLLDPAPAAGSGTSFPRDEDSVYLRHNDADVGRWRGYYFGEHPLAPTRYVHWSDGVDIKVQASSSTTPPPADALAFELLPHRRLPRNAAFQVHVQLHARGAPTGRLTVQLYWAPRLRGAALPAPGPAATAEQQRFYWQYANPHSVTHRTRGYYPMYPAWPWLHVDRETWQPLGSTEVAAPSERMPSVVTFAPIAPINEDADAIGLLVVVSAEGEVVPQPSWIDVLARNPHVALKELTYHHNSNFGHLIWRSDLPQLPRSERDEPEQDWVDYRAEPSNIAGTPLATALAANDDPRLCDLIDGYLLRFADERFDPSVCAELTRWFVEPNTMGLSKLLSLYRLDTAEIIRELKGIEHDDPIALSLRGHELAPDFRIERYTRLVPHFNPSFALNEGRKDWTREFNALTPSAARNDHSLYEFGDGRRRMANPSVPNPRFQYFSSPLRAAILREILRQWSNALIFHPDDPASVRRTNPSCAPFERLLALATTPANQSTLPAQPQFAQPAPFSSREMFAHLLTEAIDDFAFELLEDSYGTRTTAGNALYDICKTQLVYPWPKDEADAAYTAWRATPPAREFLPRPDLGEHDDMIAVEVRGTPYPFELILVPSFSPSNVGNELPRAWPFSPALSSDCIERVRLGHADFHARLAPFVMVSGGNIYPQGTQINDAIEMKRYMVDVLGMPPSAVIVEPHARHSTTNIRNCSRYLSNDVPTITDGVLITTSGSQVGYLSGARVVPLQYLLPPLLLMDIPHWSAHFFRTRCAEDLGYMPAEITPVNRYWPGRVHTAPAGSRSRIVHVDAGRSVMVAVPASYARATLHDPLDP